ncbi:MAG: F0F1 ATP synthase subunit epsilon [Burkholderiaceae bacterium]|jgi:F-type H+-transporting ATPase subunit epsilon|nr:F0F1 ATP synthase subunit epsilon [Betaproteobacteria bacterium]
MATIMVDVVSAEESVFSGEADFVALPGDQGELGILPGHTPLITRIRPGAVRIQSNGKEELIFVAGGILEVQPKAVTVLADTAIRGDDLDEAKAEEARRKAEEALANRSTDINYAAAQAELSEAMAQLAALRKLRGKK